MTDGTVTFKIKDESQTIDLQCIGIDDLGFIMQPPIGNFIDASIFKKILVDPEEVEYKIKSVDLRQNRLWLEFVEI